MNINLNLNLEAYDDISSAIKYKRKGVVAKALLEPFRPAQKGYKNLINPNNYENNQEPQDFQNINNLSYKNYIGNFEDKNILSENISNFNINKQNIIDNISPIRIKNNHNYFKDLSEENIQIPDIESPINNIKNSFQKFNTQNINEEQNIIENDKTFNNGNYYNSESIDNISNNIFQNTNPLNLENNQIFKNISSNYNTFGNSPSLKEYNKINFDKNFDFPKTFPQYLTEQKVENITNIPITYSPVINISTNSNVNSADISCELEKQKEGIKNLFSSLVQRKGERIYDK